MRLIDASPIIDNLNREIEIAENKNYFNSKQIELKAAILKITRVYISKQPTIDAVPVVRCENCVHCADDYVDTWFGAMPQFTCDLFDGYGVGIKPGHYCSYGERRSDGTKRN